MDRKKNIQSEGAVAADTLYVDLPQDWTLPDCCTSDHPDDPTGCYCCYDSWKNELNTASQKFAQANEEANQLKDRLAFTIGRRDKLKNWLDELNKLDELADDVCGQFEIIICQAEKICTNSDMAVDAIEILFCMIKDFLMQVDQIKKYLDEIKNCIACLNNSNLAPGVGIMKDLANYEDKLSAVIKLRDDLIKLIMDVIETANMLNMDICGTYGLSYIMKQWQAILNCDNSLTADNPCKCHSEEHLPEHCHLKPMITFPITSSKYYVEDIKKKYDDDVAQVVRLNDDYSKAKTKKEGLAACVSSLKAAIAAANPADRCK